MQNKVTAQSKTVSLKVKLKSYSDLTKFRLSALVVVSAILGYLIAPGEFSFSTLIYLFLGGFFVTGSSNAFNQVLERD